MPRLPPITDEEAGPPELVASIRQRRGGTLHALDRLLLRSEPVATGWGLMMGRIRRDLLLPPVLRELAMCAVAVLNRAPYELFHHAPIFLAEGGTPDQLQALNRLADDPAALDDSPLFDLFDTTQRAVLRLTVQSTRQVQVDADCFDAARGALGDDRLLFELVTVIAAYNMVSRILVAFEIESEDH